MLRRFTQRLRHPREEIPSPDRLRLLLFAWRDATDGGDARMAERAWASLYTEATAARAGEVVQAMERLELFRRLRADWSPVAMTLQIAIARLSAGDDAAMAARLVIQDLAMAAATDYRAARTGGFRAKLRDVRATAREHGLGELHAAADHLLRDHDRLEQMRRALLRSGEGDTDGVLEHLTAEHEAAVDGLVKIAWARGEADLRVVGASAQIRPV